MHMPGGEATRKWLNAERLARMKKGAIVINTGRGARWTTRRWWTR